MTIDPHTERFFRETLSRVSDAFNRSDVRRLQTSRKKSWNYEPFFIPIMRDKPLILGANPGADPRGHEPQTTYPTSNSYNVALTWRFMQRSLAYIERHFGPMREMNYFNACPFRSGGLGDLTKRDWQLGIESFLPYALDFVAPPKVLILGTSTVDHLIRLKLAEGHLKGVSGQLGRQVNGWAGTLKGAGGKTYQFAAVPHPNNPLTNVDREKIWKLLATFS